MHDSKLKMILRYVEAYAREAIGQDANVSGDTEPNQILEVLFGAKETALTVFSEGKAIHRGGKKDTIHLNFNFDTRAWSYDNSKGMGLTLLSLGILVEDWKWVNEFNPYERKS